MTREEALKIIKNRFDKWALDDSELEALKSLIPVLEENEDERLRKAALEGIEYLEHNLCWDAIGDIDILDVKEYLEKQKEQKPVKRSLEDDHIIGFVYDLLNEIEWKDNWAMSKEECLQLLNNYRPQKLTEWSEEDEKIRQSIIKDIEFDRNYTLATTDKADKVIEKYNEQIAWLKFLDIKKRNEDVAKLCSNEWSEEDKEDINSIIQVIRGRVGLSESRKQYYEKWLKSHLLPQPNTVSIENATKFGNLEYERGVKDGIQYSENRRWKPSKEQMDALKEASASWMNQEMGNSELLKCLYNDINKNYKL